MPRDLLKCGEGRFLRGNLHCHSNRSDGLWEPADVVGAYRDAGYDFICLSDHFEEEYGWQVTDTRPYCDASFTTILGAEISSARWSERNAYWVTAAGLPVDFEAPPREARVEAIARAREAGAFLVLLHPGLNNLPLAATDGLPGMDAIHAVEIYNHNLATSALPDKAYATYMLDGLLERGRKVLLNAGDDTHFHHPHDRFGGWVEVHCATPEPERIVDSLKAGRYYSTQGPALRELLVDGDHLHVETSEVCAIALSGSGDRWLDTAERTIGDGEPVTEADFDLCPFQGSFCRVTVVGRDGGRAWSNPLWP